MCFYYTYHHKKSDNVQAYLMTNILQDVVKRGTGVNARVQGIELAGKTGTTNNSVDAWFCGYSPSVEVIVWFGRDNNKRIGPRGATGGGLAAPAFSFYFSELLKVYPDMKRKFDIPEGVYQGTYEGETEYYTERSPLPKVKKRDEFAFDENATGVATEVDTNIIEVIDYDETPTDTSGEPDTIEEDDPLHPKVKVPKTPVSEDSGTLF